MTRPPFPAKAETMTTTTKPVRDRADSRRRGERIRALLALVALTGGCAALQPASVESPRLHVLDAKPAVAANADRRDLVLEVSPPTAWPGFDTPQMAYVRKPHALEYYAGNQWADAPDRMLGPLLARTLEQTGAFRAIVQPPTVVAVDLRIVTELVRLQQNFDTRPSRVELVLRVQLVDVRGKRVVATRTFEATEDATSDDPYGGVVAANRALGHVLAQAAAFCVTESARLLSPGASAP